MKKFLFAKLSVFVFVILILCSCVSDGKKAAKEVINAAKRGDFEQTKELMIEYGDTLDGQDYIDFCEELERAGILY